MICAASCAKDNVGTITIKGHVLYHCNRQPVPNVALVFVAVHFIHNGMTTKVKDSTYVGTTFTDGNGYYEIKALRKDYDYFYFRGINTDIAGGSSTGDNIKNQVLEADGTCYQPEHFNFHIKNVNPYDANDCFLELTLNTNPIQRPAVNLYGNADTTVSADMYEDYLYIFNYRVRKNSITTLYYDTIVRTTCYVPINVDVYY
jgi:hypothetical protein